MAHDARQLGFILGQRDQAGIERDGLMPKGTAEGDSLN